MTTKLGGMTSLSGQAISRLKNDPDRIRWATASAKAKEAGMSATDLLRALLDGYIDGRIPVAVPKVLVNTPQVDLPKSE